MRPFYVVFALFLVAAIFAARQDYAVAQVPNQGCTQSKSFNTSSSGITQQVAAVTGNSIRICGWGFFAGGTTAAKLVYGTGSNCGTGTTDITPAMPFTTQTGFSYPATFFSGFAAPPGNALCLNNGSSAQITGFVSYSQGP